MRWKVFAGCMTAAVLATSAFAQDKWQTGLPDEVPFGPRQLFTILTSGPSGFDGELIKEFGTGFAIAPDVIITAKHVTKSIEDFENVGDDKVPIPDRTVQLTFPEDQRRRAPRITNSDLWVTPAPVAAIDAARLDLMTMNDAVPMPLSVCGIKPGEAYYLLKFRQDSRGNGKNINVPKAIRITADEDIAARLGSLYRFRHNIQGSDNLDRPIGGDSGSPILDGEGNVVGLLSAIQGSSYLWVTPTQSFFDLVPVDVKADVKCSNEQMTIQNLTGTGKRIDILQEEFNATLNETKAALQARVEEAERTLTERYDALLADLDQKLIEKAAELADMDAQIRQDNERQDQEIKDSDLRSTSVLTAMLLEAEQRGAFPKGMLNETLRELQDQRSSGPAAELDDAARETLKSSLQALFSQKPVFPEISRMKRELGAPQWGFEITAPVAGLERPVFKVGYQRQLSLELVTQRLVMCLRPMLNFAEGVEPLEHATYDYLNKNFYASSDQIFDSEDLTNCELIVLPRRETKTAEYPFPIKTTFLRLPRDLAHLELQTTPDRFYGYTYDLANSATPEDKVATMHRFILEVDRTDDSFEIMCYYFPEEDPDVAYDLLAQFAATDDPEIKESRRCPEL